MKRFYIAVGSTAVKALSALVKRYREYGMLMAREGSGEDFFVGIDSDETEVSLFQSLSDGNMEWLLGIQLAPEEKYRQLTHAIRSDWSDQHWKFEKSGVGGKRVRSFRCMSFASNPDFTRILNNIGPNDLVFLVGSAFGGTSTGMYWNLAHYLRRRVTTVSEQFNTLYGVVIFPASGHGGWSVNGGGYGLGSGFGGTSSNFCDFLRDMDESRIHQIILERCGENFQYHPLSLALSCGNQREVRFGTLSQRVASRNPQGRGLAMSSRGRTGYLPLEQVFLITTNDMQSERNVMSSEDVSGTVAEELFLYARCDLATQANVPGFVCNAGPRNSEGGVQEGFIECNLVRAKSPGRILLTDHLGNSVIVPKIRHFCGNEGNDVDTPVWQSVHDEMSSQLAKGDKLSPELATEVQRFLREKISSPTPVDKDVFRTKFAEFLARVENEARDKRYPCATFPVFLKESLQFSEQKAKQDGGGDFCQYGDGELPPYRLRQVLTLFKELFDPIWERGEHAEDLKWRIVQELDAFIDRLVDEIDIRLFHPPKWVDPSRGSFLSLATELTTEAAVFLLETLGKYKCVARSRVTPRSFPDADYDQIRGLYAGFTAPVTVTEVTATCISKPILTDEDRERYAQAMGPFNKDLFPPSACYGLFSSILASLNEKHAFNLSEYVGNAANKILAGNNPAYENATANLHNLTQTPLIEGIEAVSGINPPGSFETSAWAAGPTPGLKRTFLVEREHGQNFVTKKVERASVHAPATVGDLQATSGWHTYLEAWDDRDTAALLDTSRLHLVPTRDGITQVHEVLLNLTEGDREFSFNDTWYGLLQLDRSLSDFCAECYSDKNGRLRDEMGRCLVADAHVYSRLLHYDESVQYGLVLGAIAARTGNLPQVGNRCYRVSSSNPGGEECRFESNNWDENGVPTNLVIWVKNFVQNNQTLFEQADGAREFFEDLRLREKTTLFFPALDGRQPQGDLTYRLDWNLRPQVRGAQSRDTLFNIYEMVYAALQVELV